MLPEFLIAKPSTGFGGRSPPSPFEAYPESVKGCVVGLFFIQLCKIFLKTHTNTINFTRLCRLRHFYVETLWDKLSTNIIVSNCLFLHAFSINLEYNYVSEIIVYSANCSDSFYS